MRFNLIQLFLQNENSSWLRKMIVDLEIPTFESGSVYSQDPAISYVWNEKSLNDDQRRAIIKVWIASSLLADGLAVAGQAILVCAFAEKDHQKAAKAAVKVLQD